MCDDNVSSNCNDKNINGGSGSNNSGGGDSCDDKDDISGCSLLWRY